MANVVNNGAYPDAIEADDAYEAFGKVNAAFSQLTALLEALQATAVTDDDLAAALAGYATEAELAAAIAFLEPGPEEDVRPRTVDDKLKDGAVSLAGYFLPIDLDFTNALKRALTTGRAVQVPNGTFDISPQELNGLSGEIVGASKRGSVLRWRVDDASKSLLKITGVNVDLAFRNLTINGRHDVIGDTPGFYAAIDFQATGFSRLEVEGVRFTNGRILDVRVSGPTTVGFTEFRLAKSDFENGMVGTATRAAACVQCQDNVRAIWIGNAASLPELPAVHGRAGFLFQRASGSPITAYGTLIATGNRFFNIGRGTVDTLGCLDVYSGARVVSIGGNTCENVNGRAISVKGDQSSIAIVGNVISNVKAAGGVAEGCPAIVLFQDLFNSIVDRDICISSNVVTGCDGYCIFVDGEGVSSARYRNALIAANTLSGAGLDAVRVRFIHGATIRTNKIDGAGANGIAVSDADDHVVVEANDIENVGAHGVDCNTALTDADLKIRGNNIRNMTGGSSRGVSIGGACRSYQIDGNDIEGGAFGVYTSGSAALSSIRRNRITSVNVISRSGTDALLVFDENITTNTVAFTLRELTIAGGAVTVWADWQWIDTEGDAASDDLDTIGGGIEGRVVTLYAANSGRDVVLKDGTGNLRLNGDFTLNNAEDSITLRYRGGVWCEASRSDNAA